MEYDHCKWRFILSSCFCLPPTFSSLSSRVSDFGSLYKDFQFRHLFVVTKDQTMYLFRSFSENNTIRDDVIIVPCVLLNCVQSSDGFHLIWKSGALITNMPQTMLHAFGYGYWVWICV